MSTLGFLVVYRLAGDDGTRTIAIVGHPGSRVPASPVQDGPIEGATVDAIKLTDMSFS